MSEELKSFTGSKDFLFDAAEAILKEVPGSYVFIGVGVGKTSSTLAYTNIPIDPESWRFIHELIAELQNGGGKQA